MKPAEGYMHRCLELATNGQGLVAPNPMVGAVVVCDDRIISEGYHRSFGAPHAEVDALDAIHACGRSEYLKRSTLFVNLEPCSHHGKTPPCAERIIAEGIPKVVIGGLDPNPLVAGRGADMLTRAGVEVVSGILEDEARDLNRRFYTFHSRRRPYVVLKWAQTSDGIMDIHREPGQRGMFAISRPQTRKWVHRLRGYESAIMVGAQTVINDDPRLDTRAFAGRPPLRVVLGGDAVLPEDRRLFTDGHPTLVFQNDGMEKVSAPGVETVGVAPEEDLLTVVMDTLYEKGVLSVLVEGGIWTLERLIDRELWDEAFVIQSDRYLGSGRSAPQMEVSPISTFHYGRDLIHRFRRS